MTNKAPMTNDQWKRDRRWSLVLGHLLVIGIWSLVITCVGCDRQKPTTQPNFTSPRIASLVPAATDLIVAMGAGDHLVAVSTWDKDIPEVANLPRAGDFQNFDWEKLSVARPDVMIVFMDPNRMPAGVTSRADALGIKLVIVKTERVNDIFETLKLLGELAKEPAKAEVLAKHMHDQLDGVARRVAGKDPVPTLLARSDEGIAIIAGDTFTDDLLTIAGGKNVARDFGVRYPTIDAERAMQLAPQVVFQLMPDKTDQSVDRARRMWDRMENLPATRKKQVYFMTEWYTLQPGSHIGDVAEAFADKLHPR